MSQATAQRPSTGHATTAAGAGLHVQLPAAELMREVSFAAQVVDRRPAVPTLAGVHLTAEHGGLRVTAHNFEVAASAVLPAAGASGATLLPAQQVQRMLRAIGRADVTIHSDDRVAVISGAGVTYRVPVLPLTEWPAPHDGADHLIGVLPLAARQRLRRTLAAAGTDQTFPTLTAVHIHVHEQAIAASCTDRYRLAFADGLAPALAADAGGWQLPGAAARLALRFLPPKDDVHLLVSAEPAAAPTPVAAGRARSRTPQRPAGLMRLDAGHRSITASLIYGEYPKVRALFPAEPSWSVTFDRLDLLTAIRQVAVAADRTPVQLLPQPGRAVVQVSLRDRTEDLGPQQAPSTSSAVKDVEVADVDGEMPAMAFSAQYLMDALAYADGSTVVVTGTLPTKPIVFATTEDPTFRHLVMPVRMAD